MVDAANGCKGILGLVYGCCSSGAFWDCTRMGNLRSRGFLPGRRKDILVITGKYRAAYTLTSSIKPDLTVESIRDLPWTLGLRDAGAPAPGLR